MKNKNKQTKFPVARIKKIMQKDEEVGKVAQATPVVISKALELFLCLIIEESNKVTASRGSKKVEAYHLKHAVETTEVLDFLKEIVEGVPDPSNGGTVDLEADNPDGKKKRGKGRRNTTTDAAAPKRRRKKKGDVEQASAEGEDGVGASSNGVKGMDVEEPDEDTEMRDDRDEYDEDDSRPPPSAYRLQQQNSSDEEDEKPFKTKRMK